MPKCMRFLRTGQRPESRTLAHIVLSMMHHTAHLQSHEETFTFNVGETEVDAAWITICVAIANYVLNAGVDFRD